MREPTLVLKRKVEDVTVEIAPEGESRYEAPAALPVIHGAMVVVQLLVVCLRRRGRHDSHVWSTGGKRPKCHRELVVSRYGARKTKEKKKPTPLHHVLPVPQQVNKEEFVSQRGQKVGDLQQQQRQRLSSPSFEFSQDPPTVQS